MVYLTKQCFDRGGRRQNGKDPFKYAQVSTVKRISPLFSEVNLTNAFEEFDSIRCYDLSGDQDNNNLQDVMDEEEDISDVKIVIASITTMNAPMILSIDDHNFELQTIVGVRDITMVLFIVDIVVLSLHHGGHKIGVINILFN